MDTLRAKQLRRTELTRAESLTVNVREGLGGAERWSKERATSVARSRLLGGGSCRTGSPEWSHAELESFRGRFDGVVSLCSRFAGCVLALIVLFEQSPTPLECIRAFGMFLWKPSIMIGGHTFPSKLMSTKGTRIGIHSHTNAYMQTHTHTLLRALEYFGPWGVQM